MAYSQPPVAPASAGRLELKWKVLISVIFGVFMVILDTTVVNVAFQTLRAEFGATLNDAQWIISVYVLMLGISTPLAGFLSERFGIKQTYLTGLALFVLGSLLCGLAPSLPFLIAARALQGFGGGLAMPLGITLLLRVFPVNEQGMALGIFGIAVLVAPAVGPSWAAIWLIKTCGDSFSSSIHRSVCWAFSLARAFCRTSRTNAELPLISGA